MHDPAAFVLARLAEDEADARDAADAEIHTVAHAHIARHDPARVLRQVAAMRRVVEHAQGWAATLRETPDGWTPETATAYRMATDWTIRALAAIWADHPAYREDWAL